MIFDGGPQDHLGEASFIIFMFIFWAIQQVNANLTQDHAYDAEVLTGRSPRQESFPCLFQTPLEAGNT